MSSWRKAAASPARAPIASRRRKSPDAVYGLKSMDGVCPKLGVGAVRINSDIIRFPKRGNTIVREKIPAAPGNRWVGLVLLFSVDNGEPGFAIMPDGVMQRMRVGGTNGLGIKYLARKNAEVVGILGSGWQAGLAAGSPPAPCATSSRSAATARPARTAKNSRPEMTDTLGVEVKASRPAGRCDQGCRHRDVLVIEPRPHLLRALGRGAPACTSTSIKRPEIEMAALRRTNRIVISRTNRRRAKSTSIVTAIWSETKRARAAAGIQ